MKTRKFIILYGLSVSLVDRVEVINIASCVKQLLLIC